jgi:uncharacterized protein (DUF4415 family)
MTKLKAARAPKPNYSRKDLDAVSDNPQWTKEAVAEAKPFAEILPELAASIRHRGPQTTPTKVAISIRLSRDVIDAFKAGGPGWQSRIDDTLRAAVKRG